MVDYIADALSRLGISPILLVILITWDSAWRLIAMWKSAKDNSVLWFVALALLNTLGILPILYIFVFSKNKGLNLGKAKSKVVKKKSRKR